MIKLDSNENQLRHHIKIKDIVSDIDVRMYPDVTIKDLREALSKKYSIPFEEIFCSNGSDNLIKILTFCLVSKNEEILIPEVAFPTYEIAAKMKECFYKLIPLKNYGIDLDETLNAISDKTKLIWISNPHNPTGTLLSEEEIINFLERVPENIYVVLDEAYIEYVCCNKPDSFKIYNSYKNVIILRTFSKAYGLAGARVGYGFARPEIYEKLALGLGPFDVNVYAQTLACNIINCDSYVRDVRIQNSLELKCYEGMCNELKIEYVKSHASFIMIKTGEYSDAYCEYLLSHDIIVKNGSKIGMPGWVRISIGHKDQNYKVIELTKTFYYYTVFQEK